MSIYNMGHPLGSNHVPVPSPSRFIAHICANLDQVISVTWGLIYPGGDGFFLTAAYHSEEGKLRAKKEFCVGKF